MVNNLKFIIIGLMSALLLFLAGYFARMKSESTDKPSIKKIEVTETKWKDEYSALKIQYDKLKKSKQQIKEVFTEADLDWSVPCALSSINFRETYETKSSWLIFDKHYFNVTAFDDCKEATARYEIGTSGNWKVYLTIAGFAAAAGGGAMWYFKNK